eukprot:CAMPEP_0174266492 /NCGR_PEP_ID=MMETSP0439-20130205/30427_1 /TAXON_ID=0 /ORGANISM="Stereomyxa ramosa, Strain Chinc5" /LENGTH=384 /DNA_ID=CAMNT_0015353497 /DNA_START=1320 /DNA_END=2474 /DNA_ORIENTATION=-
MVLHVYPWVEIAEAGGMGISEAVVVTEDGGKPLYDVPREITHKKPPAKSAAFASDNVPGCPPEIMSSILNANDLGELAYGGDSFKEKAIKILQRHFGDYHFEFAATGTAANVLSLLTLVDTYQGILCSDLSHMYRDECGAVEKLVGSRLIPLPSTNGKIIPFQIDQHLRDRFIVHRVQPKLISITQPTEYGTLYSVEEIKALSEYARRNNLYLHIDGARLVNATVALGVDLGVWMKYADVVSLGGTKNGMLMGDAVIIDKKFAQKISFYTKQHTNLISKNRFITCQFSEMFGGDLWKKNALQANKMAKLLGERIKDYLPVTRPVETNAVFVAGQTELAQKYHYVCWNNQEFRLMCSFQTSEDDINELISYLDSTIGKTNPLASV